LGGTGTLGSRIIDRLLESESQNLHVLSRDEFKQHEMRTRLGRKSADVSFHIGDVRDVRRLREVMEGVAVVICAAALKHVPTCEIAPQEAIQTNVLGAVNVQRAAVDAGVDTALFVSTDKAVLPINVMGLTKALQERIALQSYPLSQRGTRFICVRYGNVIGSRGSVTQLFDECIRLNRPLPVTDVRMTRFLLTPDEAVDVVAQALIAAQSGDLWIRDCPAAKVVDLARAFARVRAGKDDYAIDIVGPRAGEKLHETLMTGREVSLAERRAEFFVVNARTGAKFVDDSRDPWCSDQVPHLSDGELEDLIARTEPFIGFTPFTDT
jgi:UDP-glucose 4-epimerase